MYYMVRLENRIDELESSSEQVPPSFPYLFTLLYLSVVIFTFFYSLQVDNLKGKLAAQLVS